MIEQSFHEFHKMNKRRHSYYSFSDICQSQTKSLIGIPFGIVPLSLLMADSASAR